MKTLYWAISDMKRNKSFLALFIFSCACAYIMLSLIYSQYMISTRTADTLKMLSTQSISAFNVEYLMQDDSNKSNGLFDFKHTDINNSYSVIERMNAENQRQRYLYVLGDENTVSQFFDDYVPNSNDVLIGSNVKGDITKHSLMQEGIQANQIVKLKEDQQIISKYDISMSLDDYIIIFKHYEDIGILDFSNDEILNNMIILNGNDKQINEFVRSVNQGYKIRIEKFDFIDSQKDKIDLLKQNSVFYTALFITYLLIFMIMMLINNFILTDMKIREYSIHLIYGASKKLIYTRIILYNFIVVMSTIALYMLMNLFFQFCEFNLSYICFLATLVLVFLVMIPIGKMQKQNIFENMRGDFS